MSPGEWFYIEYLGYQSTSEHRERPTSGDLLQLYVLVLLRSIQLYGLRSMLRSSSQLVLYYSCIRGDDAPATLEPRPSTAVGRQGPTYHTGARRGGPKGGGTNSTKLITVTGRWESGGLPPRARCAQTRSAQVCTSQ